MKKADQTVLNAKDVTKRRSVEAGIKLADAAHVATWRLYCEVLALWRPCRNKKCRRHRRCLGEPAACLLRAQPTVPQARLLEAAKEVDGRRSAARAAGDAPGVARAARAVAEPDEVAGNLDRRSVREDLRHLRANGSSQ